MCWLGVLAQRCAWLMTFPAAKAVAALHSQFRRWINASISDSRHATVRLPRRTGAGYMPSFIPSYQVVLLTG